MVLPISMLNFWKITRKIRHFSIPMRTNRWPEPIVFFKIFVIINQLYLGNRISPTLSTSRSQSIQPEEEPEKIRKWREQQKELIEKKGFLNFI